jgi:uncharacterized protein YeaO (DUF488 family)
MIELTFLALMNRLMNWGRAPVITARAIVADAATLLALISYMTLDVRPKRVYERSDSSDGYRVLIDHIWPRGVSHSRGALDEWARELAPSGHLHTWFDHRPERFEEFRRRYRDELAAHSDRLNDLRRHAATGRVTIVHAARDRDHNNAIALAELLRDH